MEVTAFYFAKISQIYIKLKKIWFIWVHLYTDSPLQISCTYQWFR